MEHTEGARQRCGILVSQDLTPLRKKLLTMRCIPTQDDPAIVDNGLEPRAAEHRKLQPVVGGVDDLAKKRGEVLRRVKSATSPSPNISLVRT